MWRHRCPASWVTSNKQLTQDNIDDADPGRFIRGPARGNSRKYYPVIWEKRPIFLYRLILLSLFFILRYVTAPSERAMLQLSVPHFASYHTIQIARTDDQKREIPVCKLSIISGWCLADSTSRVDKTSSLAPIPVTLWITLDYLNIGYDGSTLTEPCSTNTLNPIAPPWDEISNLSVWSLLMLLLIARWHYWHILTYLILQMQA